MAETRDRGAGNDDDGGRGPDLFGNPGRRYQDMPQLPPNIDNGQYDLLIRKRREGTYATLGSKSLARSTTTLPRVPRFHPDRCTPNSKVLAATSPDAVPEQHSKIRAGPSAAQASPRAVVEAPIEPG